MDLKSLEIKVARSENLPALPQIVSQVLKLVDDPSSSPRDMEKVIERDPGITAKLLKVSGSALYGMNNVPTIGRAISILGMNTIRTLVIGVAYQQIVSGKPQAAGFDKISFWRHCLATAVAARIIGKLRMPMKAEELYCAGMLHDVGLLVMDRFAPEELDQAIKSAETDGLQFFQAEQLLFGFDHARIGDLLADRWHLPPLLRQAIRHHHDVCEDDTHQNSTCIIAAADYVAHKCGYTNLSPTATMTLDENVLKVLEMPEEQLDVIGAVVSNEVTKAEVAFRT